MDVRVQGCGSVGRLQNLSSLVRSKKGVENPHLSDSPVCTGLISAVRLTLLCCLRTALSLGNCFARGPEGQSVRIKLKM